MSFRCWRDQGVPRVQCVFLCRRGLGRGYRRAFTFIEALVVIAVVSVLVVITMVAVARVRESGRSAVCMNNVRQLAVATMVIADADRGRLPYFLPGRGSEPGGARISDRAFLDQAFPSGAGVMVGVASCPSDGGSRGVALRWSYDYLPGLMMEESAIFGERDPVLAVSEKYRNANGSFPFYVDSSPRHGHGDAKKANAAMYPDCSVRVWE